MVLAVLEPDLENKVKKEIPAQQWLVGSDLGDHIRMNGGIFLVERKNAQMLHYPCDPNAPFYGVDTQRRVVIYYNTTGLPNQPEIELEFAQSVYTEYKNFRF